MIRKFLAAVLISSFALSCTACGEKSYDAYNDFPAMETGNSVAVKEANFANEATADAADFKNTGGGSDVSSVKPASPSKQKLIITMDIAAETNDINSLSDHIEKKVSELGGYIDRMQYDEHDTQKNMYFSARIPEGKLSDFMADFSGKARITSKTKNTTDISLDYSDTETRLMSLKKERNTLLKLMDKAELIEDVLQIEQELTNVRTEIETVESRLKVYDNKVEYSTVNISLRENTDVSAPEAPSYLNRVKEGFVHNFKATGTFIADFLLLLITHIPQLILLAVVIIVFIVIRKKRKLKKQRKQIQTPKNSTDTPHDTNK